MRGIRAAIAASLVVLLAFSAAQLRAEDKPKDLIVGKWEPAKIPAGAKAVIEFTKEGKVLFNGTANGKDFKFEGKYKFTDDNTMEMTLNYNGKEDTKKIKVIKVNKDQLVTKDEGDKKEEEFKRVK